MVSDVFSMGFKPQSERMFIGGISKNASPEVPCEARPQRTHDIFPALSRVPAQPVCGLLQGHRFASVPVRELAGLSIPLSCESGELSQPRIAAFAGNAGKEWRLKIHANFSIRTLGS